MSNKKVFVYGTNELIEYPLSDKANIELEIQLWNRGKSEANQKRIVISDIFPPVGYKLNNGQLVELSLAEKVDAYIVTLNPDQKMLNGEIVNKTEKEMVVGGLISVSDWKLTCKKKVEQKYSNATQLLLGQYVESETLGWQRKEQEAREWILADAITKEALALTLGIATEANFEYGDTIADIDVLAQSIVAKADLYWKYYHTLTGIKNKALKQVTEVSASPLATFYDQTNLIVTNLVYPKITEL